MLTNTTVILLQFWGRMFSQTDALLRRYSNSNCILWDHICQFWSQQHVGHFCVKILKLTLTTNEAFLCTNPGHKFPTHRSKTERLWSFCTRVKAFGCYGFMWTKLRCKIKLILIEGGWNEFKKTCQNHIFINFEQFYQNICRNFETFASQNCIRNT